jgi:hypothetical protein
MLPHSSHSCHIPRPSYPPWFDHRNNIWWRVHDMKFVITRSCVIFHNIPVFYNEDLLTPPPTPKLKDHPLVGCLRQLFRSHSPDMKAVSSNSTWRTRHAMVAGIHITSGNWQINKNCFQM